MWPMVLLYVFTASLKDTLMGTAGKHYNHLRVSGRNRNLTFLNLMTNQ